MIKNFTRVVSMMCALLLASATMVWANAAQSTQNQADGQHKNHGQQRQQGTQMQTGSTNPNASRRARSRARLAQEIRHELVTLPFYDVFDWLEFEINQDGTVVTLRGQTVRPTLKSDAEARVKDIEGVAQVNNQIEVLPLSPQDNRLRLALYQTLYAFNSPLFR